MEERNCERNVVGLLSRNCSSFGTLFISMAVTPRSFSHIGLAVVGTRCAALCKRSNCSSSPTKLAKNDVLPELGVRVQRSLPNSSLAAVCKTY